MRKTAPWPVDWIDPAEAIARRALSLLDGAQAGSRRDFAPNGPDIAVFTSGKPDHAIRRLMQGFGLTTVS